MKRKRILVCPMDWGLGHATRCIPLIRSLLARECEVGVASSGDALVLLREEFPHLVFYSLPGYRPYYSKYASQVTAMALQIPKFLRTIRQENHEIEGIIARDGWDLLISDNRYGCRSGKIPSIFLTHQLNIQAPVGSALLNRINHRIIRRFSQCWVPDIPGEASLAGKLSAQNGFPVSYVGPLSRFSKADRPIKYQVIGLASGPEPQRQIWENLLRREFLKLKGATLLVRGIPGISAAEEPAGEVDHLNASELNQAILESEIVVSRPGYSTIMDLAVLRKKAIFVPTPGQTEQEYLGRELMKRRIALCMPQHQFELSEALALAATFNGFGAPSGDLLLQRALDTLIG